MPSHTESVAGATPIARVGLVRLLAVVASLLCLGISHSASAQRTIFMGHVLDAATERAIEGAHVEVPSLQLRVQSDSTGAFRIRGINVGVYGVIVRAIGYDPMTARLSVDSAMLIEADFLLSASITTLNTVRVNASRPERYASRLREFDERRRFGLGRFLDWTFFENNKDRSLGGLLVSRIAGVRTRSTASGEFLVIERYGKPCFPQTVVNGIVQKSFNLNSVNVDDIIGFEYCTVASTPAQFGGSGERDGGSQCGTAVFWLK